MKNQIKIFIGLLSLLNLKMKEVLTLLALYEGAILFLSFDGLLCQRTNRWKIIIFEFSSRIITKETFSTKSFKNFFGGILSKRLPNQMKKLFFYFERSASTSDLSVYVKNYRSSLLLIHKNFYTSRQLSSFPLLRKETPAEIRLLVTSAGLALRPKAAIKYANADLEKIPILLENKGKAGVYRWENKESGKSYIGSSVNLGKRFRSYFNLDWLESKIQKSESKIYRSLLKYGYSKFSLEILEYCSAEQCLEREQYFLDLIQPEYNILKKAGSLLGFKHSEDTKAKFQIRSSRQQEQLKNLHASKEHQEHLKRLNANAELRAKRLKRLKRLHADPEFKGRSLSALKAYNSSEEAKNHLNRLNANPELQAKRLEHLKNLHANPELKAKRLERIHEIQSHQVSVLDSQNNETSVYPSIREAARAIGITPQTISQAFKRKGESTIWIKKKRYGVTKLSIS